MTLRSIASCDVCGGPSWWCLDRSGDVWALCQDVGCSFNLQEDLFPEEPIWETGVDTVTTGGDTDDTTDPVTPFSDPGEGLPF